MPNTDASTPKRAKNAQPSKGTAAAADMPDEQQQPKSGSTAGPALSHTAAAAGSKSGVSRTGSIKRHGSTTSRRLQALLASEELSSLSLLGTEGSELPGG